MEENEKLEKFGSSSKPGKTRDFKSLLLFELSGKIRLMSMSSLQREGEWNCALVGF